MGRSRGGLTSKIHLSADGRCRPAPHCAAGVPGITPLRRRAGEPGVRARVYADLPRPGPDPPSEGATLGFVGTPPSAG